MSLTGKTEKQRLADLPGEKWLEVTTRLGCRVACGFCPQGTFVPAFRQLAGVAELTLDTFRLCLRQVPQDVHIVFAGFTEPWLNPDCTSMVRWAAERKYVVRVYTTMIGMSTTDATELGTLALDGLYLHLPTATPGRMRVTVDQPYLEVLDRLAQGYGENATYLFHGDGADLHPRVAELLQHHGLQPVNWQIHSRAGHLEQFPHRSRLAGPIVCSQGREHKNVLLPDGSVALCCMDWGLEYVLGNLLDQDYETLFASETYQRLMTDLRGPAGAELCRRCEWAEPAGSRA